MSSYFQRYGNIVRKRAKRGNFGYVWCNKEKQPLKHEKATKCFNNSDRWDIFFTRVSYSFISIITIICVIKFSLSCAWIFILFCTASRFYLKSWLLETFWLEKIFLFWFNLLSEKLLECFQEDNPKIKFVNALMWYLKFQIFLKRPKLPSS